MIVVIAQLCPVVPGSWRVPPPLLCDEEIL